MASETKSPEHRRYRVFADTQIQGGICLRIAVYWVCCQFVVVGTQYAFATLVGPEEVRIVTQFFRPALFAGICVLPFALLDMLIFSNKFAGPIRNLRRNLRELSDGDQVSIEFRKGDYLCDLKDYINRLGRRLRGEPDLAREDVAVRS